jgi:hypothetical protein
MNPVTSTVVFDVIFKLCTALFDLFISFAVSDLVHTHILLFLYFRRTKDLTKYNFLKFYTTG